MSFRLKIFLAVLIPAVSLVSLVSLAGGAYIRGTAEARARDDFDAATRSFETQTLALRTSLEAGCSVFKSPRFEAALEAVGREELELAEFANLVTDSQKVAFGTPENFPLCTWGTVEGRTLVRQVPGEPTHLCVPECRHPEAGLAEDSQILWIDVGLVAAVKVPLENGRLVAARRVEKILEGISSAGGVEVAFESGGGIVYATSAISGLAGVPGESGETLHRGVPYRYRRHSRGAIILASLLWRDEILRDLKLGALVLVGLSALAAYVVSRLVAVSLARPVVELEAASRKVGEGDLSVQVEVRSKDELGRLGGAFNEMVRNLKKRTEVMQKTLSHEVERKVMAEGDLKLGGRKQMATIMFLDVRGYTTMTEGMDPAQVLELVNGIMSRLERLIRAHHGNVNKYLGDGFMALFGAPESSGNDALNAVEASRAIQAEMKRWNEERKAAHLPPIYVGIGLNTDEVLAGFVGSEERLEYTALGEGTNLSSRLCSKAERGQTLASYTTHRDAGVSGRELEPVHVKGFSVPVRVYEV